MRTTSKTILVLFVAFVFLSNSKMLTAHCETTRLPGVEPGQVMLYWFNTTVTGNDTEFLSHGTSVQDFANITVLSVSGVNVTCHLISNTTGVAQTGIFDVERGLENGSKISGGLYLLVSANLTVGDSIFIGNPDFPVINDTIPANYLDRQLEANYWFSVRNQTSIDMYGHLYNITETTQEYWEKKTGILLECFVREEASRPDGVGGVLTATMFIRFLILSADPLPPVIPEFATLLVLPLFTVATLLSMIAFRRKRKNRE